MPPGRQQRCTFSPTTCSSVQGGTRLKVGNVLFEESARGVMAETRGAVAYARCKRRSAGNCGTTSRIRQPRDHATAMPLLVPGVGARCWCPVLVPVPACLAAVLSINPAIALMQISSAVVSVYSAPTRQSKGTEVHEQRHGGTRMPC